MLFGGVEARVGYHLTNTDHLSKKSVGTCYLVELKLELGITSPILITCLKRVLVCVIWWSLTNVHYMYHLTNTNHLSKKSIGTCYLVELKLELGIT